MIRPKGILIAIPAGLQMVMMQTTESLYHLGQYLAAHRIPSSATLVSSADIEEARNLLITTWYDQHPEFSHILFVDADMGFHPTLIGDMIRFNQPLTGALYAKRKMPASIVGTIDEEHDLSSVKNGFLRVSGMGCGVMLIKREVIDVMLEKMPEIIDRAPSYAMQQAPGEPLKRIIRAFGKIHTDKMRLSEDMAFCWRWQQCGGEVWANVDHKISHIGPFDYHFRYQGVLEKKQKDRAREQEMAA